MLKTKILNSIVLLERDIFCQDRRIPLLEICEIIFIFVQYLGMCLLLYIFDCIQKSLLFFLARTLVGTVLKGIIFQWLSLGSQVLSQFAIQSVKGRVCTYKNIQLQLTEFSNLVGQIKLKGFMNLQVSERFFYIVIYMQGSIRFHRILQDSASICLILQDSAGF